MSSPTLKLGFPFAEQMQISQGTIVCNTTTTLDAKLETGEEIVLYGEDFTPAITDEFEPISLSIFADGTPVIGLPWRYDVGEGHHQIYITNYDTEFTDVKINVQCRILSS